VLHLYNDYKDKNFVIVGYTIDTNKKAGMGFINDFGLDFPTFIASDLLQDEMKVRKIPETFIYDKEGNLLEMVPGMVSERYLEVFAEMGNNPSE
jgi:thioredoxin-related protein